MAHFRIADNLLDTLLVDPTYFVIGNIAADCSRKTEELDVFYPDKSVSHFMEGEIIKPLKLLQKYDPNNFALQNRSLILGYYVHLHADNLWKTLIIKKIKIKFQKELEQDPLFIWTMKEDWYDLDHLYLYEHPDFRAFRLFNEKKDFVNNIFSHYEKNSMEDQIRFIQDFYNNPCTNFRRDYFYLQKKDMDEYVKKASNLIAKDEALKPYLKQGTMIDSL